jgi:hypothetical protein
VVVCCGDCVAPAEVLIVTLTAISRPPGIAQQPDKATLLHGRLVRSLAKRGRPLSPSICFDEPRDPVEDSAFAQAVREAGNGLVRYPPSRDHPLDRMCGPLA